MVMMNGGTIMMMNGAMAMLKKMNGRGHGDNIYPL